MPMVIGSSASATVPTGLRPSTLLLFVSQESTIKWPIEVVSEIIPNSIPCPDCSRAVPSYYYVFESSPNPREKRKRGCMLDLWLHSDPTPIHFEAERSPAVTGQWCIMLMDRE